MELTIEVVAIENLDSIQDVTQYVEELNKIGFGNDELADLELMEDDIDNIVQDNPAYQ